MAYVVWRVLMKKYCKVRLGIQRHPNLVTPSNRESAESSDEQRPTWKPAGPPESPDESPTPDSDDVDSAMSRVDPSRKSKTHRVKGYLRRCKDALSSAQRTTPDSSAQPPGTSEPAGGESGRSAWYVADDVGFKRCSRAGSVQVLDDVVGQGGGGGIDPPITDDVDRCASESVTPGPLIPDEEGTSECVVASDVVAADASLHNTTENNESGVPTAAADDVQESLCSLLERLLAPAVPRYRAASVRNALLREARDLLVCVYGGDLADFERRFLAPAAQLIAAVVAAQPQTPGVVVSGWPITLGNGGLVLHLGELDSSFLVRPGDCYLCVRANAASESAVELALIWRSFDRELHSRSLLPAPPDSSLSLQMDVLPDLLRGLLVTVERAVERAPLEALAFPCPLCGRCYESWGHGAADGAGGPPECVCRCRELAVAQERSADLTGGPVFALGGSIPHIDSDEDEDAPSKRLSAMTGMLTKLPHDVVPPKAIKDLSEKLLTCGITFPGTRDVSGRPLVVVDAAELSQAGLSCFEVATLLLYYTSLPSEDSLQRGIAVLVLLDGGGEQDVRVWELLDTSLLLLGSRVPAQVVLSWEPQSKSVDDAAQDAAVQPAWRREQPALLPCSRIQCHRCVDGASLSQYLPRHQTPERCGGSARHDQREWTRFFREYEAFRERCCDAGRRLMAEAAECNATDEHTGKISKKVLHRQHRALSRSLLCPALRALRRDASGLLQALSQRAAAAGASDEVAAALVAARRLTAEVERACAGLEQLAERRRERLREMAREQALEHETDEVLTWMRHSGEDALQSYDASGNNQDAKRQEQDFEHFYFISMRQLDRGADLCEEASKRPPLQDTARTLRAHMRGFSERLEATRERLEESARVRQPSPAPPAHDWGAGDSGIGACANCEDRLHRPNAGKPLDRSCSCRCYSDPDPDHDQEPADGSEGCPMSNCTDELEDESFEPQTSTPKTRGPLEVNSHLHCHASNIDLPSVNDLPGASDIDPKTYKTLLLITREMIQTERDYVKSLDYIIEHYLPELLRDDIPQALRGQRNVVFGNVEKIYEFHNQHFLRELERCETNPLHIGRSFLRHEKKFYLYALYNKNKPKSDSLMSEYGSSFFKSKQLELCDKMDLASYLLKPVQRMGKYALLLQQLMKAASPEGENCGDLEDLRAAEQMVRFQLRHGNDLLAMDSLRECDVNVKEQGRLLRQNEFLVWEGKSGKKSMRQVFLFEDLILFSKARRFPDHKNLDLYIYKNSIKTSDIGLTARIGDSSTKFEIWFRKRKPNDTFTLQPMSEDVKKAWTEEISQLLWKQALRNREVRLAEMSSMGIGNKPCLDIRPSSDQISDRSISIAQLSKTAPRFRNSISSSICSEISLRVSKRPHSIISVSSVSSGSSSSTSSASGGSATSGIMSHTNTTDSLCQIVATGIARKSPRSHHRSTTLNSQCSTESGILADISLSDDILPDNNHSWNGLSKSSSSASSTGTNNLQTLDMSCGNTSDNALILNRSNDDSNLSNCSSCNQMPLLLYQNDQEMTVNL